jgi:hypothetical protein
MGLGSAITALAFMLISVAQVLISLFVLSYAAYSFLVTLTSTAAGNDEVIWPGDPIQDWLGKVWYLGWLATLWAVPAVFLARAVGLPPNELPSFLVIIGVVWLLFPVSLLSALSASSSVVILRPKIVGLFLKHFGSSTVFYAVTAVVLAGCGIVAYLGVMAWSILVPVAALLGATGFLFYARFLGRIGWIISREPSGTGRRRNESTVAVQSFNPWATPEDGNRDEIESAARRPIPANSRKIKKRPRRNERRKVIDPWAVPPEHALPAKTAPDPAGDPYGPVEGTYEMTAGDGVRAPLPDADEKPAWIDRDTEPYAVSAPHARTTPLTPFVTHELARREEEINAWRRPPPGPAQPLVTGLYGFPFYPTSLNALVKLAAGFLAMGLLARLQVALFPF